MARYIARRLALLLLVLLGMSLITFALTHMVPGDPARLLAGPRANATQVEAIAKRYGLDRPLPEQYLTYMAGLLKGDFGQSLTTRRPVLDDLRQRLPASMELTFAAMALVVLIGLPLGTLAAVTRGRAIDHAIRLFTIGGVSMPIFWFGLVVQIVFYKWFPVLPV